MSSTTAAEHMLILGAGSDIAGAIARAYAAKDRMITLALRDPAKAKGLMQDLERAGAQVRALPFDAERMEDHEAWYARLDPKPGLVICAFGFLPEQAEAQEDHALAMRTLVVNFNGAVSILEQAARDLSKRGSGTIIGIASVAGERGRASNGLYGSAKAGFSAYLSGLRNRLARHGVHVVTVKPGFVRTRMTAGRSLPAWLTADPQQVGAAVLRALRRKRNIVYVPGHWRWIMLVVNAIPEPVFKRMRL
jgi:hypothetical protein